MEEVGDAQQDVTDEVDKVDDPPVEGVHVTQPVTKRDLPQPQGPLESGASRPESEPVVLPHRCHRHDLMFTERRG